MHVKLQETDHVFLPKEAGKRRKEIYAPSYMTFSDVYGKNGVFTS